MLLNLKICERSILLALSVWMGIVGVSPRLMGQGATASILGTVSDTTGTAISEAAIQIKNLGTGLTQSFQTDAQGRFRVPDLGVGSYEVQASKVGFSTMVRTGITLTVGGEDVVDFALPVGQQQQTITVQGEVSQVETTESSVGALVDSQQMRELPLNGRNFEQLILLAPGVQAISAFVPSGYQGKAPEYSIAGSRPTGQAILLDDENLQNFWNKGMGSITGSSLGVEAIGEFQTLTNTYSSRFGGNGAVINAVSKSGANSLHGSAFEFLRNSALDARSFFDPHAIPAFRRNQFGGSVGGPIKKNKAFFFVNYEGIRQALGETKVATVPDSSSRTVTAANSTTAQAIAATVALFPLPTTLIGRGLGQVTEVANQPAHENYVLARFDYTLSDKDSLFLRYISDKADLLEPFSGTGTLPFWPESDASPNKFTTFEERRVISPTLVNVARVSFSRTENRGVITGSTPPLQFFPGAGRQDGGVAITGLSGLGPGGLPPYDITQNRFTEADDVLWARGAHSLRFGMSISRPQTNAWRPFTQGGGWTFQSLTQFLAGQAFTFVGVPLTSNSYPNRDWRYFELTPYIQDDWKVTSKLTLNLGLRWEFATNPHDQHDVYNTITDFLHATGFVHVPNVFASNPTWGNYDPRVGFAYDPFADHETSIRGGFGMFRDLIGPSIYTSGATSAPPWSTAQQVNPVYPIPFTAINPGLASQSSGTDYQNNHTPYMIQWNLNIQREIAQGTILSVGYVGSHGVHLFSIEQQNAPFPTIDSSGVYHFASLINGAIVPNLRRNPSLGSFQEFEAQATSHYHSLQTTLNRRLTRNVQAQVAYTYSKCIDNGAEFSTFASNSPASLTNPFDRAVDNGVCPFDITHTLRVNGLVTLPFHGNRFIEGWQVSGIESASSGAPFTITSGFDQVGFQGGATPRPNYVAGCDPMVGTVIEWFNPACFTLEAPGTLGNLGRNTMRGPRFVNTDLGLIKDTKIHESLSLQFRAEAFNLLNHANFAIPAAGIFTAGTNGGGNPNPSAGRITSTVAQ